MISVNNISLNFSKQVLFDGISFLIRPNDRIGLVGNNGSGKTTLLKIILGTQEPDNGSIEKPSGLTIGYLPQQMKHVDNKSLFNEVKTAFGPLLKLQDKADYIGSLIENSSDFHSQEYLSLINELSDINTRLDMLGAAKMDEQIEKTLYGLGFVLEDMPRQTSHFSGGWRMRIELAKILLANPDILLLDEPTNHLDIESIQWLEQFLATYRGAVVLISHDRAFLDNVTKRTIEISLGKIYDYKVPYSRFTALRKERRQQQLAAYKNQQKEIADINRFIERFRYKNTKAVQVQSRIKYLDKLERIEIDAMDTSSINIRFPASPRSGNVVIEAENISKNYGDKKVLDDINMYIRRGERIAFVGKNGEGKTTLSRILVGDLDFKGSLKTGHNVKTGYFAQNQDELLDGELTVLDDLYRAASGQTMPELRSILGAFLFGEDDIDKKIKFLSGGERSRLALIKLLLAPYNFLILDEPTNHLDMRSKDILKQALLNFAGTIVLVSHDREFLEGLAETVYEFKSQKIKKYTGGIADFLESRKINSLKILEIKQKNQADAMALQEFSSGKDSYIDKKEFEKNLRKLTKDITKCEDKIEVLEKEIAGLSTKFESNSIDYSDSQNRQLFENYAKLKDELDKNVNHWEELHRQLAESRDYDKGPLF